MRSCCFAEICSDTRSDKRSRSIDYHKYRAAARASLQDAPMIPAFLPPFLRHEYDTRAVRAPRRIIAVPVT